MMYYGLSLLYDHLSSESAFKTVDNLRNIIIVTLKIIGSIFMLVKDKGANGGGFLAQLSTYGVISFVCALF